MDNKALISIITPSFNCASFLKQCIESVLSQNYECFEHIIVDGASTDGTVEILRAYPHLRWISEPDKGEGEALNKALRMVRGDIVGWLNADDYYLEGAFHRVAREIDPQSGRHVIYGKTNFIDEKGEFKHVSDPIQVVSFGRLLRWYDGFDFYQPSIFYSGELIRNVGFFRDDLHFSVDYEYWLRIIRKKYHFYFVDQIFATARLYRSSSKSSGSSWEQEKSHQKTSASYIGLASLRERLAYRTGYFRCRIRQLLHANRVRIWSRILHSALHKFKVRTSLKHVVQLIRDASLDWGSRSQKAGLRCALVEYNYYHGEILPILVYALNELGVKVDVYSSKRLIYNNPFIYCSKPKYSLRACDELFFRYWIEGGKFKGYDFLMFGSIEPKEILNHISGNRVPIVAVMHNAGLIKRDPDYARFFAEPNRVVLVLAKHISSFLANTVAASWVWFVNPLDTVKVEQGADVCFCVQGNLEFERRNYDSLFNAIEQIAREGIRNFRVMIVGRNDTKDGMAFKESLKKRNLDHFFTFSKGELVYEDYYNSIAGSHFVLPLVDGTRNEYAPYFSEKASTAVLSAMSLGIVPIIQKRLASLYEIEDASLTYEDGGLYDALKFALNIGPTALRRLHSRLLSRRESLIKESVENIKGVLKELGFKS